MISCCFALSSVVVGTVRSIRALWHSFYFNSDPKEVAAMFSKTAYRAKEKTSVDDEKLYRYICVFVVVV